MINKYQRSKLVWDFYKELSQTIRHYNESQSKYRTIASTWLLATIAGVGFIFTNDIELLPKSLAVGCIGFLSSVGLLLLWTIDLLFYQRLLDAAFIEIRCLETVEDWLPQIRNNVRAILQGKGLNLVTHFYMFSITLTGSISILGIFLWLREFATIVQTFFIITFLLICLFLLIFWILKRTSTTQALEVGIWEDRINSYKKNKIDTEAN